MTINRNRQGNCGCFSLFLAILLLPIITAHPLLGLIILAWLIGRR